MVKLWKQIGQDIDGEDKKDESGDSVSLSLDGMTVAIGASYNDGNGKDSGHVRVYQYNIDSDEWEQIGQDIDGEANYDVSGESVSLSSDGKTVAIGAPYNNGENGVDSGHVRVYQLIELEPEPIVKIETFEGTIEITLHPDAAPAHVENFLKYVRNGDYNNTFFHRLVPGFVIQAGGYYYNNETNSAEKVISRPPVTNEFKLSNLRGTVAMAKLPNKPNSARNQWFINLVDNSENLDNQNGGFTVFGTVTNMDIVDRISSLSTLNFGGEFTQLPLKNFDLDRGIAKDNLVIINLKTASELKCLTEETTVNVVTSNGNKYVFNNSNTYDPNKVYGLANGTYIFRNIPSSHPMALLNNGKENSINYSGDINKKFTKSVSGTTSDGTYDFYYGDISVIVNNNFEELSIYCYYHGYMGGENLLSYSDTCTQPEPDPEHKQITVDREAVIKLDNDNNGISAMTTVDTSITNISSETNQLIVAKNGDKILPVPLTPATMQLLINQNRNGNTDDDEDYK